MCCQGLVTTRNAVGPALLKSMRPPCGQKATGSFFLLRLLLKLFLVLLAQLIEDLARLAPVLPIGQKTIYDKQQQHDAYRHQQRSCKVDKSRRYEQEDQCLLPIKLILEFHVAKIRFFSEPYDFISKKMNVLSIP
jgi:hypothetical protein